MLVQNIAPDFDIHTASNIDTHSVEFFHIVVASWEVTTKIEISLR
jgi:hypothetical protein